MLQNVIILRKTNIVIPLYSYSFVHNFNNNIIPTIFSNFNSFVAENGLLDILYSIPIIMEIGTVRIKEMT